MRTRKVWLVFFFSFVLIAFLYVAVLPVTFSLSALVYISNNESSFPDVTKTVDVGCADGDLVYESYCVLSLSGDAQNSNLGSVTLCTQATVEFLHHISVLCERWGGPLSVAVYSPELDYSDARTMVDALRNCDFCVRHWVSWHFFGKIPQNRVFIKKRPQASGNQATLVPKDCQALAQGNWTTKRKSQGTYPINVGRNIARNRTHTPFVFSLDIELYPSRGVLAKFDRMQRSSPNTTNYPHVWVLPVFEVHSKFSAPETKFQLRNMFTMKQAVSFHKFRCDECHRIPNLTDWLNHEAHMKSEVMEAFEEMKVWMTIKRSRKISRHYWEPFFIGTREDPEFDIRLSWEGKQNKMQMAYEMCMKNYDFHIVDNAFLVHAPGINIYNAAKEQNRQKYQKENNRWISIIRKDLIKRYGFNDDC